MAAAARRSAPRNPAADAAGYRIGPLTTYADPAAMAAWLEGAEPGAQMVYATGPILGAHAARDLAQAWQQAGKVHLFQSKAGREHCTDYCIEKRPAPAKGAQPASRAGMGKATRGDLARLARLLRSHAAGGRACPSLTQLAQALDLPRGNRGRRRAQYLLDKLAEEGRVRIDRSEGKARIEIPNARSKAKAKTHVGGDPK